MPDSHPTAERPSATGRSFRVFLSLRGRLIVLVCFATVPAVLFIFFAAVREREAALERMETEARHIGSLASREHAHQLSGAENLLWRLSSSLACVSGDKSRPPACPDYLPALLSSLPQFANIGLADTSGAVVCSAASLDRPASLLANVAFDRAVQSDAVEVGSYVVGFIGRPVLHLARALRGPDRRPCAVTFVAVELGWLDQLAEQANLPEDYSLLITDREGHVLARSGAAAEEFAAEQGRTVPDLAEALTRPRGAVLEIGDPPTARYFVATEMEDVPGVFVVAGLPFERVQATANRAFYRTLVGLILVTIFAIASAILAAEFSVLRVLRALTRAVRRFGAGDLSARPPLPGSRGELLELALAFGTMADALAARQREAADAQDRLRALSHHLQTARDEEAGRIARELHDELGQILTGLKMELVRMHRLPADADAEGAGDRAMSRMRAQIDDAIESVRRISSELRPPVLDRLGLAAAIDWLVRDCETKSGLAVLLSVTGLDEPIDQRVSIALFRVVQEALTNVVRHAAATEVHVDLAGTGETLRLSVQDNGRGFVPSAVTSRHAVGILGMRERVHLLGGRFRIEGAPDRGTTVLVEVPRRPKPVEDLLAGERRGA